MIEYSRRVQMDHANVWITAILSLVVVAGMFFSRVREFSVADVDAGATVGPYACFWLRGKNVRNDRSSGNTDPSRPEA
jgi:hypothetical protein